MDRPPRVWPALDLLARHDVTLPPDISDILALVLDDAHATALEEDEALRHWRVHFADDASRRDAADLLRDRMSAWIDIHPVDLEDEGWVYKVQDDLRAVRAGRIVVAPPWDVPALAASGSTSPVTGGEPPTPAEVRRENDAAVPRSDIVIVIEPSMGFGTGHHQSTRLCLHLLQWLPLQGTRVIDVGTGSGVLALAARRLGADDVLAVDNDADSIEAARDNLRRNGADPAVRVEQADIAGLVATPADVVIANLTVWLLRRHREALDALVAAGGCLVTGGFTADQTALVIDAFPGFVVERTLEEEDWVGITLRRR